MPCSELNSCFLGVLLHQLEKPPLKKKKKEKYLSQFANWLSNVTQFAEASVLPSVKWPGCPRGFLRVLPVLTLSVILI